MRNSILKMAGSTQRSINLVPQTAHSATICGQTGYGKTVFILDLLEGPYRGFFQHSVVLCPTERHNRTYQQCPWIWTDRELYLLDPDERLHDYLRAFYHVVMDEPTLYIIYDCSAWTAFVKKKDMLSMLAVSGRHAEQSVWALTQKKRRTCASRRAGFVCFTARTAIPSKTVWERITLSPHENSGRWCGSS